jgi:2-C-methyl-D-erythritol 2,4-cyclodiphosphate synthase
VKLRIGQGYDVHRFGPGDHVILGGVRIDHPQGMVAHSDGDVPLHALCDALLGAAGLGDIGRHFPDSDARYAAIDSRVLLREVVARLQTAGYRPGNVDLTIVAQQPKLSPHLDQMRQHIAADLAVDLTQVNVKATTTEGLGFSGRKEGIASYAVALIQACKERSSSG